jgi:hypothetical protein
MFVHRIAATSQPASVLGRANPARFNRREAARLHVGQDSS